MATGTGSELRRAARAVGAGVLLLAAGTYLGLFVLGGGTAPGGGAAAFPVLLVALATAAVLVGPLGIGAGSGRRDE